ncbi:Protein of unknown function [Gryllus bimaculatus]|nr:Protein of unknown function [Gryllus bimaculatus]
MHGHMDTWLVGTCCGSYRDCFGRALPLKRGDACAVLYGDAEGGGSCFYRENVENQSLQGRDTVELTRSFTCGTLPDASLSDLC